jgi:Cu(I)/Ag(I) efflux system membrane fusion protein/cobalt-zinc-cadmium efflux system membrane fusion protein
MRLVLAFVAVAIGSGAGGAALWHHLRAANGAPAHPGSSVTSDETASDLYTCGMHPEVVNEGPGTCPICGMDLTPMKPQAGEVSKIRAEGSRKIKHWVAPMDPTYISEKPGKSPMGMDLVPVYEGEASDSATVTVDPVVVQNMGVRVAKVQRANLVRRVRAIGEVEVAEDLVSVVNLKYSGWVEKIHVDETGVPVKKGQPLFAIYSPELVSAQEEYLLALRSQDKDAPLARSARQRLEFWDLGASELDRIAQSGKPTRRLTIRAPASGYVLHKNVVQGARVNAGQDLYRVGSLSRIWVTAEVYELDAPWVKVGQRAQMELSFQAGKAYEGKVSYIYPTLNKRSRTLRVRLELTNPGLGLKPGMFATVHIEAENKPDVLVVPTEAILRSGQRLIVFIARGGGRYEARGVTTGLVGGNQQTEVLSGLEEGEQVVLSGQFLLDSESQLHEALQKYLEARLEAKPAMGGPDAGRKHDTAQEATGETYWTCPMHPNIVEDEPGICPICGMDLVEKRGARPVRASAR